MGLSDTPGKNSVKLFCPKCEELYNPRSTRSENIDGAFFGTTFPHLFFLEFPELKPTTPETRYIPRVFGFKVHESAQSKSLEIKNKVAKEAEKPEGEARDS